MSQVSSVGSSSSNNATNSANGTEGNDLSSVSLDDFLQLMIKELQNQDPLNPTDNNAMLQQLTQIRQMGATNQLTTTLSNFAVSGSLSTASSLIGKEISALDDNAKDVKGVVDKVSVAVDSKDKTKRLVKVHVGASTVDINNVREILPKATT